VLMDAEGSDEAVGVSVEAPLVGGHRWPLAAGPLRVHRIGDQGRCGPRFDHRRPGLLLTRPVDGDGPLRRPEARRGCPLPPVLGPPYARCPPDIVSIHGSPFQAPPAGPFHPTECRGHTGRGFAMPVYVHTILLAGRIDC